MRIILVRHYKTLFNVSGQIMGWGDSPKAENWLEDLLFVETVLTARGVLPDIVYSSALGRARHTGDYFAEKFELRTAHHRQQLNEINYGILTEKSKKWVTQHFPEHKTDADFVYPQGESFNSMQSRAVGFVDHLLESPQRGTTLCVVHAGVIRALVSHYLKLNFGAQLKRRISHRFIGVLDFDSSNCCTYEEWGEPSGFIVDGVVALPQSTQAANS
jgi:broad specificity phosphatase PhoE